MRIIHEIHTPMQVSCSPHPYRNIRGICGYNGIRVEVFMCTSPAANFPDDAKLAFDDDEVLEIEGPLEVVLDALKQTVGMLESVKEHLKDELGPKSVMTCPNCEKPTADTHIPNACHTWECESKWSPVAQKQLEDRLDLLTAQRQMVSRAAEGIANEHTDCGGAGCSGCKWTGRKP